MELAGIEPATATLAGRARSLAVTPTGRPRHKGFGLPFHGAHTMDVSMIKPVREARRDGRS